MRTIVKGLIYLLLVLFPAGYLLRVKLDNNISFLPQDIIVFFIFILMLFLLLQKRIEFEFGRFFLFQFLFIIIGLVSLFINSWMFGDVQILTSTLYSLRYVSYISLLSAGILLANISLKKALLFAGYSFLIIGFVQFTFFYNLKPLFPLGWDDHLYRLFSTFLDPNFAGVFYVLFFLYLLYLSVGEKFKKSYMHVIGAFFTIIAIYLTYSRTALVAVLAGIITVAIIKKWYKALFAGLVVFIILLGIVSDTTIEGLNPLRTASSSRRLVSMQEAFQIFQKSPLVGSGFNAYRYAQIRYGFRTENGAQQSNADAGTDNSTLFVLATTGILGLIFYVASFFYLIKQLINEKLAFNYIIVGSLAALFTASLFINALFYTPLLTWIFLIIARRKRMS